MWQTLRNEIRYARNIVRRRPGFTIAVIATLALGIAAATSVFSTFHAILLRPLPYRDSNQIVTVWNRYGKAKEMRAHNSVPDYFDRKTQSKTLDHIAAYQLAKFDLTGRDEPVRLQGALVTASLFPLLGVQPIHGRAFTESEDRPEANKVIMVSYGFWKNALGGDPAAIGRTLNLNGNIYTIVGIMPPNFRFPDPAVQIWRPIAFAENEKVDTERGNEYLSVVARMKSQATLAQVRAEMELIASRVPINVPDRRQFLLNAGWGAIVVPLHELLVSELRPAILILMGAVAFLFLIVCANVTHLLLVRSVDRSKEMAIRFALGANRIQIFRSIFSETILLTVSGGIAGLILTHWALRAMRFVVPVDVSNFGEITVDLRVIAFGLAVSTLTGLFLALLTWRRLLRSDISQFAKATTVAGGKSTQVYRGLLVSVEVALALMLSIAAMMLTSSLSNLLQENPGFRKEDRLTFGISLPASRYPERPPRAHFYQQVLQSIRTLPEVKAAGATGLLPLASDNWTATFAVDGYQPAPGEPPPGFEYRVITPGYLRAMGIRLRIGRDFSDNDTADSRLVVLIDEKLAARFWPGVNPIGKRLGFSDPKGVEWREIVGVVGHISNAAVQIEGLEQVYFPHSQMALRSMFIVIHTSGDPAQILPVIRSQIANLDKQLPLDEIRTLEAIVLESLGRARFQSILLAFFAGFALLLGMAGIYGVTSYTVKQQTREIGIRMALGASNRQVLTEVLRRGIVSALAGIAAGIAGSFAISRILSAFLFKVNPTDPIILSFAAAGLLAIALIACYIPARYASRVSPIVSLRYE